jgi:hypothetical protein
MGIKYKEIIP